MNFQARKLDYAMRQVHRALDKLTECENQLYEAQRNLKEAQQRLRDVHFCITGETRSKHDSILEEAGFTSDEIRQALRSN